MQRKYRLNRKTLTVPTSSASNLTSWRSWREQWRGMLFIAEDRLKTAQLQYQCSTFVCVFKNEKGALVAVNTVCVRGERPFCLARDETLQRKVVWSAAAYALVSGSTCASRSLSAPVGGSSSWPCTRPPSGAVPPRCRSVWAGVCIYSRGSAPSAAGSASPALRSKAASPGWTWTSTWSLETKEVI